MKNLISIFILFVLFSCEKEPITPQPIDKTIKTEYQGQITAQCDQTYIYVNSIQYGIGSAITNESMKLYSGDSVRLQMYTNGFYYHKGTIKLDNDYYYIEEGYGALDTTIIIP